MKLEIWDVYQVLEKLLKIVKIEISKKYFFHRQINRGQVSSLNSKKE